MSETKIVYMCSTDFDTELGMASGQAKVFNSLELINKNCTCVQPGPDNCGIYEVEITVKKIVQEQGY